MSPGVAAVLVRIEMRDRAGFVRERREELTIACAFFKTASISGCSYQILTAIRLYGCEQWMYLGTGIDGPTDRAHNTPSTCVC